jgi:hypothetical protein
MGGGYKQFDNSSPCTVENSRINQLQRFLGRAILAKIGVLNIAKSPPVSSKAKPEGKEEATKLRAATGSDNLRLQNQMLNQALGGLWIQEGQDHGNRILATLAALEAIAPTDALEGMLATQMVATHEAAMECLRRAVISGQTFAGRDVNLKHAEKLLQIYARQVEALDKHRGRGQQKITVEHVTVQAGGQAIVGNVQGPATSPDKAATKVPPSLSDQTSELVPLPDPLAAPLKSAELPVRSSSG